MKPFLLEPIHDYTIWGTNHISKARGIDEDYGTWWEVSAHPYCSNKIVGTDKTLMEMIQENQKIYFYFSMLCFVMYFIADGGAVDHVLLPGYDDQRS